MFMIYCLAVVSQLNVVSAARRDYSVTACESVEGGICRRNDQACGGVYVSGLCLLNVTSTSVHRGPHYHQCCLPAKFVPPKGYSSIREYLISQGINVPEENCDDPNDPACGFYIENSNDATVKGLLKLYHAVDDKSNQGNSGNEIITVLKANEISHQTNDYGKQITAIHGYILQVSGSGQLNALIRSAYELLDPQNYSGTAYKTPEGHILVLLSPGGKIWEIMFNGKL